MTIGVGTTVGASRTHYQICARCIMDASDPLISFDENGVCHHCHHYDELIRECVIAGEPGGRNGKMRWRA